MTRYCSRDPPQPTRDLASALKPEFLLHEHVENKFVQSIMNHYMPYSMHSLLSELFRKVEAFWEVFKTS